MFKAGTLYRHISCLDTDLYILDVIDRDKSAIKLKVKYYNRYYKYFMWPFADIVEIKSKDFLKWNEII